MPRPASANRQYLEEHHGKWRVTVAVPRSLQAKLGTKLKRELATDSLTVANQIKWQVVTELKAQIEHARTGHGGAPTRGDSLTREALARASERARAQSQEALETLDHVIQERAEELRGNPVEVDPDHRGRPQYAYDPVKEAVAGSFKAIASGEATPIGLHHAQFIAQGGLKPRTQADDYRAMKFLEAWCDSNRVRPTVEAITRKAVIRFVTDLPTLSGVSSPATLRKYLNRLSLYWRYLLAREHAASDPWHQSHKLLPSATKGPEERPFTDEEVARLLSGPASPAMHDLMRLAALTGARLDVIVDLKVKDCADDLLTFKPQKKELKPRSVPIHPALVEIIARRCEGRGPDDDVFPEWPVPAPPSLRERSFKASNAFTIYRRKVGVDDAIEGKRRSLVNFHSFRRWFITKAEQADQSGDLIAAVVGHKRKGMTLGRYSAGPLMAQARRCVEAVNLPA